MRRRIWHWMAVIGLVAGVVSAGPPEETTRRLEMALRSLDKDTFAGSYRIDTHAVISKPDGSNREDTLEVMKVRSAPGGEPEMEIVRATRNGQDITAQRRNEQAKSRAKEVKEKPKAEDKEGGTFSATLRLPIGKDLGLFEFGASRQEGGVQVVSFAPRISARNEDNITQGTLAWDTATGDPLWLEARYVDPPTGIKELVMRFELVRQGDVLFLRRTTTQGVGGMLWIKRKFDLEMVISDLQPAPPSS